MHGIVEWGGEYLLHGDGEIAGVAGGGYRSGGGGESSGRPAEIKRRHRTDVSFGSFAVDLRILSAVLVRLFINIF